MTASRFPSHRLLLVFVVCVVVLLTGPERSEGQTYHNIKQLRSMVSLFRGLKKSVKTRYTELMGRTNNMTSQPSAARTAVLNGMTNITLGTVDAWVQVTNISAAMGITLTSAARAMPLITGIVGAAHVLGNKTVDRGIGYISSAAKATVTRAGVYVYHIKVQTGVQMECYFSTEIRDKTGAVKKTVYFYCDWEVAPFYLFLNLLSGDSVITLPIACSIGTDPLGTQTSLHYIGRY